MGTARLFVPVLSTVSTYPLELHTESVVLEGRKWI
jgi:hypothetical protein